MKLTDLILLLVTIFTLILAVFLSNRWIPKNVLQIPQNKDIPKFSTDAHFDPYPNTINVENKYDCNISNLRVCDINDNTTLFGCKELTVRCRHFDKDTKCYAEGKEIVVPKNAKRTEGYALAITMLAEACNPYHGDLVLVAANKESTEYMMICACKNPGFIGNEHLLDSCSSVFICNGNIDNINQPLEKIECVCESGKISKRSGKEGDAPVCETMTVNDANKLYSDWTHLTGLESAKTISISQFNATIRGNVNVSKLIDPCSTSLLNSNELVPSGKYLYYSRNCFYDDGGIPVNAGILDSNKSAVADAVLPSGQYRYIRFTDNVAGHRKRAIANTELRFHPTTKNKIANVLLPEGIGIGNGDESQVRIPTNSYFVSPKCYGAWPTYHCKTRKSFGHREYGLPMPEITECPGAFLWNRDWWDDAETLTKRSIKMKSSGVEIDQTVLVKGKGTYYGVAYSNLEFESENNINTGLLSMKNYSNFRIHANSIT